MIRKCYTCNFLNDLPEGTMPSGMQGCIRCGVEGTWHALPGSKWYIDKNKEQRWLE